MSPPPLESAFRPGRAAFMPFLVGGDPTPARSLSYLRALLPAADVLEVGLPFSDPLADGPTIQQADERALRAGATPQMVLELVEELSSPVPVVLLSYLNPILAYGPASFLDRAASAGVSGLIVPDLPPEEAADLRGAARSAGIRLVCLAAPNSPDHRLELVASVAQGFVYCISLTGITGARRELPPGVEGLLARLRRRTELPLAVGFGISRPEQVRVLSRVADGVIVGSALVARVGAGAPPEEVGQLARELARARDGDPEAIDAAGGGL